MASRNLNGQPFTFANRRFQTDASQGFEHLPGEARGSFLEQPLQDEGGYRLYLEHVVDRAAEQELALVWYDPEGSPPTTSPTTLLSSLSSQMSERVSKPRIRRTAEPAKTGE